MAEPTEPLDNQEGVDSRPDWLESNFKTVEAQAQAYAEARREMHQQQSRAQELEAAASQWQEYASELEAAQQQQPTAGTDTSLSNPLLLQLRAAREMGDEQTELALMAYVSKQIAEQSVDERIKSLQNQPQGPDQASIESHALWADYTAREKFDGKYGQGAWDETKREAAEFLQANPDLIPETLSPTQAADRLVMAAEYVQGQKYLTASEQERNQMVDARARRLQAQTLTTGGTPPPTVETDEDKWNRIANAETGSYSSLRRT